MELVAPAGPVYQAGTLSGNPLAMTAGLWSLGRADAEALSPPGDARRASRRRTRRCGARRRRAAAGQRLRIAADAVLHRPSRCATTRRRLSADTGALRALLPRHAGARRLSAAVTVRGVVPVGRAHAKDVERRSRRRARAAEELVEIALATLPTSGRLSNLTRSTVPAGNTTSCPSVAAIVPPPPIRMPSSAPLAPPRIPPRIAPTPAPAPIFPASPRMPSLSIACVTLARIG